MHAGTPRAAYSLIQLHAQDLGRLLDHMDRNDMWKDTMLIVNTDHGFLLGEHGWWSKNGMPLYQELVNTPLFIWDPRSGMKGERRKALTKTIDIPATLLVFFGMEPTCREGTSTRSLRKMNR